MKRRNKTRDFEKFKKRNTHKRRSREQARRELLRAVEKYRMLVYAIVLIVVMILTNNKTAKRFIAGIVEKFTAPVRRFIRKNNAHEYDESAGKEEA